MVNVYFISKFVTTKYKGDDEDGWLIHFNSENLTQSVLSLLRMRKERRKKRNFNIGMEFHDNLIIIL